MATEIRVVLADDHPVVRQGLRQAIEQDETLKIVAEAGDGQSALSLIETHKPEIAVIDIEMPSLDGFGVARLIRERQLAVKVIFHTVHREEDLFNQALSLGAKGYVLKDSAITDIVSSIRAVASGQNYISPALTTYLLNQNRRTAALVNEMPNLESLTPTERRILRLIAEYKTNKMMADELFVSKRTIEKHREIISEKLDIRGSHALLKFALSHKSEL